MQKVIALDFDGTVCSFAYPELGEPNEGVKEALTKIREMGYEIHIYTCRTNSELHKYPIDRMEQARTVIAYMEKHELPCDGVFMVDKPLAYAYIDDRGIAYRGDWKQAVKDLEEMEINDKN